MGSFAASDLPCHGFISLLTPSTDQCALPRSGILRLAASERKFLTCNRRWLCRAPRVAVPRCQNVSVDTTSGVGFDRRQLLRLASSVGVATLPIFDAWQALADPVQYPDYNECNASIDPGNGAAVVDCCISPSQKIIDFKFPTNLPMRVRLPAHQVDAQYVQKYVNAYTALRQLPANDPRRYAAQWNLHCALCDGAYTEAGTSNEYQVHNSWLFLPWHRWYVYFHERILAKLIKDDSFALPFWSWDTPAGNTFPSIYVQNKPIYDADRNPKHMPPTVVDLNYNFSESGLSPSDQQKANDATMYRQIVTNATTPSLFFGQAYRQGDDPSPGAGTLENVPHGTVHSWTGDPSNPNDENMGALYSAARDAVFYAHHSNVDRMWEVWKSLGGRRQNLTDPDWLNATFLFYDENANLVRVKVSDALDTTKLAYKFQKVDMPWLKAKPSSKARSASKSAAVTTGPRGTFAPAAFAETREEIREFKERKSNEVKGVLTVLVKRPKQVKFSDFEEEVLLLEGVRVPTDKNVKFDVFINLPEADEKTGYAISEYAGTFYNLPHLMKHADSKNVRTSNFRIAVGGVLNELGIEEAESFTVTIVPRVKSGSIPLSIKDVKIAYE
eukprot:c25564_g1_i1 orf=490-2328(+)